MKQKTKIISLEESIIELARAAVDSRIGEALGGEGITRKLLIEFPDGKKSEEIKFPHFKLEKLLNLVQAGRDTYLYGPPGTGKTTAAQQAAQILGLPYSYVSLCPQSSESLLFGFIHAGGSYVETEFYRLYRDGGVFCLDEMDNGNAALLNKLNSLLENGHGSFPCGMVKRHEKFFLVATGNTNGNGGNLEFPDRRAFDPAFKERFAFLEWPIDPAQEKLIALSISPSHALGWLDIIAMIRQAVKRDNVERLVVSPRATYLGCSLLEGGKFAKEEILDMLIFKGISLEIRSQLLSGVSLQ